MNTSALYYGLVTHARLRPRQHRLSYHICSVLLDLDELEDLRGKYWFFSINRFNLFSFHTKDRGNGSGIDLKGQVEKGMREAGLTPDGGPIRLLTMPRVLGWSFNPISIFFCYRRTGEVTAILWEVDNTFGERHGYLIPVEVREGDEILQECNKKFYVSPFLDMNLRYVFRVKPPGEALSIVIDTLDGEGLLLTARHLGKRFEMTDAALVRAFVRLPFQTLGVITAIHWEAIKIWWKGNHIRTRPPPPADAVSVVMPAPEHQKAISS